MSDYVEAEVFEAEPEPEFRAPVESQDESIKVHRRTSDKVVKEAKRRFDRCETWEAYSRRRQVDDQKFEAGDDTNGYQWPQGYWLARMADQRPALTINETRQHCLLVINDAKQNKPSIKVRPVGDGASYEAAEVIEGVIRHIEYQSNAHVAYDTATETQVKIGVGYWRVTTRYVSEMSFDQDIFIERIADAFSCYIDPDCAEKDCSDAKFAFVFCDMPRTEFDEAYPQYKDDAGRAALGNESSWYGEDTVRICEYWRRYDVADKLIAYTDPKGARATVLDSQLTPELTEYLRSKTDTRVRQVTRQQVEWFKILGNRAVERREWPGKYLPVVRVVGEDSVIEGRLDRKGHVRALRDPQRMYNYWTSAAVEAVALQSKVPWIGPVEAFEGRENIWERANRENFAFLAYNGRDENGQPIPAPTRPEPPQMAQAYISGMQIASQEMQSVTGQFQAQQGREGNETSGKAINARQRQSDTATYHYVDNLAIGIRYTGRIILDLIPKIYDTPRMLRVIGEDGTNSLVSLDPSQAKDYAKQRKAHAEAAEQIVINPTVGTYDVQADIGPAYATRRQEAFNAIVQVLQGAPTLINSIGDLLFKNSDFPAADEIADRMRRMVPAALTGDGPTPEMQQLGQQLQNMKASLDAAMQALANKEGEIKASQEDKIIDAYKAETERYKAMGSAIDPQATAVMVAQLVHQMLTTPMDAAMQSATQEMADPSGGGGDAMPHDVDPLADPVPTHEISSAPTSRPVIPSPDGKGYMQVST
jgi:hypothetical protein